MAPVQPDEKLSPIIGERPMSRSELTRRLWEYIQKNGLQDRDRKVLINADEKLEQVFDGRRQVNVFEMIRLVYSHCRFD